MRLLLLLLALVACIQARRMNPVSGHSYPSPPPSQTQSAAPIGSFISQITNYNYNYNLPNIPPIHLAPIILGADTADSRSPYPTGGTIHVNIPPVPKLSSGFDSRLPNLPSAFFAPARR